MPLAFSYSRVSSGQQVSGGGLSRQADMAQAWADANNYTLDTTLDLSDQGRSAYKGEHLSKGALGRFLDLAQRGQLGDRPVLLIEAIDRLSRQEPLDALQQVAFALVGAGVVIIDLEDGRSYDRESLQGDALIMLVLKARAAHDFSKRLGRRLSAHWDQARDGFRDGSKIHRGGNGGRKPFWLELTRARDGWQLIPEKADLVCLVFDLLEDLGLGHAAAELNQRGHRTSTGVAWRAEAVLRMASDPATYGALRLNKLAFDRGRSAHRKWRKAKQAAADAGQPFNAPEPPIPEPELIAGHYPAVVTYERWLQTQERISSRRHLPRTGAPPTAGFLSILQGLAVCEMGSAMGVTHSNPQRSAIRHYLRCRARLNGKRCSCSGMGWHLPAIHCHVIRRLGRGVLVHVDAYRQRDEAPSVLEQKLEVAQRDLAEANSRLEMAQRALDQAIDSGAALSLLERLNTAVDRRQKELEKAQQWLGECQARCSVQQAAIRPDQLLTATPAVALMRTILSGHDTAADRQALNRLLQAIGLRVVLDGTDRKNPRVWMGADGVPPQCELFRGEAEHGMLALDTLFTPPPAPAGPLHIGR